MTAPSEVAGTIRLLGPGDEEAVRAFLMARIETSMFLLGNMRRAGLAYRGQAYGGTYVGRWVEGELAGVVSHVWRGNLVLQAPEQTEALAWAAARESGRPVTGAVGPTGQVNRVLASFGLPTEIGGCGPSDLDEKLYTLELDRLRVPEPLATGCVTARRIEPRDVEVLVPWGIDFAWAAGRRRETADAARGVLVAACEGRLDRWVLEADGETVATSTWNSRIDEAVQVGGVYTPPNRRGRGFARAVVAASLVEARDRGAGEAVLFTDRTNAPALRAYGALGFAYATDYRLIFFPGQRVPDVPDAPPVRG